MHLGELQSWMLILCWFYKWPLSHSHITFDRSLIYEKKIISAALSSLVYNNVSQIWTIVEVDVHTEMAK